MELIPDVPGEEVGSSLRIFFTSLVLISLKLKPEEDVSNILQFLRFEKWSLIKISQSLLRVNDDDSSEVKKSLKSVAMSLGIITCLSLSKIKLACVWALSERIFTELL